MRLKSLGIILATAFMLICSVSSYAFHVYVVNGTSYQLNGFMFPNEVGFGSNVFPNTYKELPARLANLIPNTTGNVTFVANKSNVHENEMCPNVHFGHSYTVITIGPTRTDPDTFNCRISTL